MIWVWFKLRYEPVELLVNLLLQFFWAQRLCSYPSLLVLYDFALLIFFRNISLVFVAAVLYDELTTSDAFNAIFFQDWRHLRNVVQRELIVIHRTQICHHISGPLLLLEYLFYFSHLKDGKNCSGIGVKQVTVHYNFWRRLYLSSSTTTHFYLKLFI